ncbi:hypothetical protein TNCV_1863671 [Trichonephila clavipes]|nr:hypothetical protein TNCV_1863671 [Trichonephila clavipes]
MSTSEYSEISTLRNTHLRSKTQSTVFKPLHVLEIYMISFLFFSLSFLSLFQSHTLKLQCANDDEYQNSELWSRDEDDIRALHPTWWLFSGTRARSGHWSTPVTRM